MATRPCVRQISRLTPQASRLRDHPSLEDLDQGDLKFNVDFRSVYTAVLEDWMGAPAKQILGRDYRKAKIIAKA